MIASDATLTAPPRTERLVPEFQSSEWTPLERFAFRFVFAYFTAFFCGRFLLFDAGRA